MKIKCPFCESNSDERDPESNTSAVELISFESKEIGDVVYSAKCNACGANGPICDMAENAVERFNNPGKTNL